MNKLVVILFTLLLSSQAFSKRFTNGYIEFELPPGWECMIEGSEWVCQSNDANRKKEAIIILAAKKRGEQDNLEAYKAYLEESKTYKLPGGKIQKSEKKTVKIEQVNGQSWVDALHLASEIPGFYTRYLATVKSDIGVAVTFSVTKSLYSAYKGIFDNVIASMRVFREGNIDLSKIKMNGSNSANRDSGDATFVPDDSALNMGTITKQAKKSKGGDADDFVIYLIIGVVALLAFLKLKKKK